MEIRKIRPADAEKFVEFYEKLVKESDYLMFTPKETAEKAKQEQKYIEDYDDYKQVFVATEGERIVGYLGISCSHLSKLKHTARFTVGVLRDSQRQGIADKLIAFAENWAREKGVGRLEITVVTDNLPAIALFEKHHYEREGIRKKAVSFDDKYADEYFMAKVI